MVDFYPLISRAVGELRQNTPEARRALYDRVHNSLLAELAKSDFTTEIQSQQRHALEDAIQRIEANATGRLTGRPDASPANQVQAAPAGPRAVTQTPRTRSDEDHYRELTHFRDFQLSLKCPDCGGAITDYSCNVCTPKRGLGRVASGAMTTFLVVVAWCMPIALGVIGFIVFRPWGALVGLVIGGSMAKYSIDMFLREGAARQGAFQPPLWLAQRYQRQRTTYNQAALCYFKWVTSISQISAPNGFIEFIRNYRNYPEAIPELRARLCDATFAQVCGRVSVLENNWMEPLLGASFTGSDGQQKLLEAIIGKGKTLNAGFVNYWSQMRYKLESANNRGVDLKEIDLRLPSSRWIIDGILQGHAPLKALIGSDVAPLAFASYPFCRDFAYEMADLKWMDSVRLAMEMRKSSATFSEKVSSALQNDLGNRSTTPDIVAITIMAIVAVGIGGGILLTWDQSKHGLTPAVVLVACIWGIVGVMVFFLTRKLMRRRKLIRYLVGTVSEL